MFAIFWALVAPDALKRAHITRVRASDGSLLLDATDIGGVAGADAERLYWLYVGFAMPLVMQAGTERAPARGAWAEFAASLLHKGVSNTGMMALHKLGVFPSIDVVKRRAAKMSEAANDSFNRGGIIVCFWADNYFRRQYKRAIDGQPPCYNLSTTVFGYGFVKEDKACLAWVWRTRPPNPEREVVSCFYDDYFVRMDPAVTCDRILALPFRTFWSTLWLWSSTLNCTCRSYFMYPPRMEGARHDVSATKETKFQNLYLKPFECGRTDGFILTIMELELLAVSSMENKQYTIARMDCNLYNRYMNYLCADVGKFELWPCARTYIAVIPPLWHDWKMLSCKMWAENCNFFWVPAMRRLRHNGENDRVFRKASLSEFLPISNEFALAWSRVRLDWMDAMRAQPSNSYLLRVVVLFEFLEPLVNSIFFSTRDRDTPGTPTSGPFFFLADASANNRQAFFSYLSLLIS